MRIYLAGDGVPRATEQTLYEAGCRNRLLTFAKEHTPKIAPLWLKRPGANLFLDSGAFSAFTQGQVIDLDDYCSFIERANVKTYSVLDVIGDPKRTAENLRIMRERGLKPMPAFHFGSSMQILNELLEENIYVAIGGLAPLSPVERRRFLDKCFQVIMPHFPRRIHLFGVTSVKILERYPAYSADSTSFLIGGGLRRTEMKFSKGKMRSTNKTYAGKLDYDGKPLYVRTAVNNAVEAIKQQNYITELWKARGITWQE